MARTPGVVVAISLSALGAAGLGVWFVTRANAVAPRSHSAAPTASPVAGELDPEIPPGVRIDFDDVAERAGLRFRHFDGRVAQPYLMDTTGPGLAWLDYNCDGLFDLFLVQGSAIVGPPPTPPPTSRLYRNEGGGRFRDVTEALCIAPVGCGQGAAVGDIDNDGDPDLFVTFYGKPNELYRNESGQRFVEVGASAGVASPPAGRRGPNWATSAAFLDYDADGYLDLFVCNYVEIDPDRYPICKTFCSPHEFKPSACTLYRNRRDGTFIDVEPRGRNRYARGEGARRGDP